MSSRRRWDEPGPSDNGDTSPAALKTDDSKSASEAAAAAAAIAAKIAAQFAGGSDGEYVQDLDINDIRNRYMLTRSSTQEDIKNETGASVSTKGVWYPDKARATPDNPPLYLHIRAPSRESLQRAVNKVNELIAIDLGSLVEDKTARGREKRRWPEAKLPVGLESIRNFNVRAKVVGPQGLFVKHIQQETGTRVQIKGIGSGFVDQETGKESDEPLHIHITGPEEGQVARAKVLTEDLLLVVRQEWSKAEAAAKQHQMELHQAQAQYAAYSQQMGYAQQVPTQQTGATAPMNAEAFAQYWAQYGYDVNSPQFKEWAASQQAQYAQSYSQQQQQLGEVAPAPAGAPPPAPPGPAPAPPPDAPPPPPPGGDAPPPPPPPS